MQITSIFVSAIAASATVAKAQQKPCRLSESENSTLLGMPWRLGFGAGQTTVTIPTPPDIAERGVSGYGNLYTRFGKCVDVKDGKFSNGNQPQVWDCNQGSANQQFKMSGNTLRTTNGMCLDVPWGWAYPGAPVQLWGCDNNNRNQFFETAGNSIRKIGTNFCLDVKDGHYDNGGGLQLFSCDWNWAGGNQMFTYNKPAQAATQGSPSAFLGYAAISIERFGQLHPECAPWVGIFRDAAASTGLHPTLVAAVAENESTCRERPNNGFGMMQFMDENAFRAFGGGDKQKASDAIWAGARYLRTLLDQNGQNLDSALRAYNGPVSQGGDPNYQAHIRVWMSGGSTW